MFEMIKTRFEKGFVRLDQLRRYVELGVLTPEQFNQISGEDYIESQEG